MVLGIHFDIKTPKTGGKTPKSTNYNIKDMRLSDEEIGAIWGKLELWDWNIQQLNRDKIYICVVDIQK